MEPLSETSTLMGAGGSLHSSWARFWLARRSSAEGPSCWEPPLLQLLCPDVSAWLFKRAARAALSRKSVCRTETALAEWSE